MIRALSLSALLCLVAACGESPPAANRTATVNEAAPQQPAPVPDIARVRIETEAGAIIVELDGRHAPVTTGNFLAYVDQHRFDGTSFYRASRTEGAEERGFVQGGIRRDYRRMLAPIAHEPTSATGLSHRAGTISMARGESGAMGNFFITTAAMPSMDAHGREQGYAAFGHVVEGMDVVRRILAAPTDPRAGSGAMRGQMLAAPVRIARATRIE